MDLNYPDFTLTNYRKLIEHLNSRWQVARVCDAFANSFKPDTLILRHDIDQSLSLALPMAEVELSMGIQSTYFVALHLYYNPHLPVHAKAIQTIANMGHEIGFHYDGNLYPGDDGSFEESLALLDRHVQILQEICGSPVISIARHNPSLTTQRDPFQGCMKYHNAYDERLLRDTVYISDSCGAWRADGLRKCWHEPRLKRIYLLIHPEHWGETTDVDRMAHFESLRARVLAQYEKFFEEVRSIWRNHSGGKEHDERVRLLEQGRRNH